MEELKPQEIQAAIAYFEDAVRESDEIIDECTPALQAELTEQKQHFVVALNALHRATSENSSELEQLKADNSALKAKYDEINRYNISCTKKIDELLVEKQDTDAHLKAINDSLAEQLRRVEPENKPLTCEGCIHHNSDAPWSEICFDCKRQSRQDMYHPEPAS